MALASPVSAAPAADSWAGDLAWPLRRAVALYPEQPAVRDGEQTVSYRELDARVAALRGALADAGLSPGARVGYLGVNSLAHVECWLGVPTAGFVLVDLNFRLGLNELAFIVADCAIELLVCDETQLPIARALRERCDSLGQLILDSHGDTPADCVGYEQLLTHSPAAAVPAATTTLAAISYTGGTTGSPKGVMLSHGNLLANARHNLLATGHTPADRWLHVCPMFHVAGTANVFACTWVGAHQVVLPRFDAARVLSTVREQAISHTVLVPTMLGMLLEELERDPEPALSSLRHIQYAASPIAPALQRRVLDTFACDVAQFYGMTEAAPTVTHLSPADHRVAHGGDEAARTRLGSIGTPVVGVETEVRRPGGGRCEPDEIGELCVRGPNIMLGYWGRPEATASALVDGWYRTGDAARVDVAGYIYLVDRLKDMIISGGENVYSIEVEAALSEHPAVLEAAVFGVPDPRWGEAVHAVVVLAADAQDLDAADLIAHCRTLIAGYKLPRTIELRREPLPKSGAGKVLKHTLREPFWAEHSRRIS